MFVALQDRFDPSAPHLFSQMNLFLDGSYDYTAALLALTDVDGNHLLDIFDIGQKMRGELEGNVRFGAPDVTEDVTLTVFSEFETATIDVRSGEYAPAIMSLVGGYARASTLSLINPGDGDANHCLSLVLSLLVHCLSLWF